MTNKNERATIGIPLESDITKENKALRQETSSLKAQLGMLLAQKREEEESEKEVDEEQEVIKDLKKQEREILLNRFGQTVSLIKFANEFIRNKKFRENLELTDKDDKEVLSNLGDILVSEKGMLVITDVHGNPMSYGHSLSDIIYKPETFGMQLKRGRLLMPYDKDFNHARDFEELEINDVIYNEDAINDQDRFKETTEYRAKAKELLKRRILEIREKNSYIQKLEVSISAMDSEMKDLKRSIDVLKNKEHTTSSELSQAMAMTMQFSSKIGDMNRKIANLTELKALYESKIEKLESVVNKLLAKMEEADKTMYQRVKEEVQGDIEWAKTVVPEQTIIKEEPPKQDVQMLQPGQPLGQVGVRK